MKCLLFFSHCGRYALVISGMVKVCPALNVLMGEIPCNISGYIQNICIQSRWKVIIMGKALVAGGAGSGNGPGKDFFRRWDSK